MPSLSLTRALRLRHAREFQRVYARGRRFGNEFFTATVLRTDGPEPRLGMSVAARRLGGSVSRNRVRRLIRESFRVNQHALASLDIVIGARASAKTVDNGRLRAALERLWQSIIASCARSSHT